MLKSALNSITIIFNKYYTIALQISCCAFYLTKIIKSDVSRYAHFQIERTSMFRDGSITSIIYGAIRDEKYDEAIEVLNNQLLAKPDNRSALSLLGYCYYQIQDYVNASDCYEQLSTIYPECSKYRMIFAQSLYKAELYSAALKTAVQIDDKEYQQPLAKLKAAILFASGDSAASRSLVEGELAGDPQSLVNIGCLLYQEGKFKEACEQFQQASQDLGPRPTIIYNIALCYYQLQQYSVALKYIAEVIERGIREHPEMGIGMTTEGLEVRSVGNTLTLRDTALVETFNLKAAIEYRLDNLTAASDALTDMPPRTEQELDHITLHNEALINIGNNPSASFEKLQFLLQQETFPPEAFANLILLYLKYEYFDLAADVLADNSSMACKYMTSELYNFIEAVLLRQNAPQDAYNRLDQMAARQTEQLRRLTKCVQEARQAQDGEAVRRAVLDYDVALESYIPILMQQAKIFWDLENYQQVEKIFRKSIEFCNDHKDWRLNVAHVLFVQQSKFHEAASFYEPIVKHHYQHLLELGAVVVANLCVAYIMTNQNEDAEELMRKVEREEEALTYADPNRKTYHLCIINLVIGTLYCAKGNYEFGMSRVIESMEPYHKKLGPDTWFYTKRCFLSMIENMAKHLIMISDNTLVDCIQFLENCELYGRDIKAFIEQPLEKVKIHPGANTVSYEARQIKALLLEFM